MFEPSVAWTNKFVHATVRSIGFVHATLRTIQFCACYSLKCACYNWNCACYSLKCACYSRFEFDMAHKLVYAIGLLNGSDPWVSPIILKNAMHGSYPRPKALVLGQRPNDPCGPRDLLVMSSSNKHWPVLWAKGPTHRSVVLVRLKWPHNTDA